MPKLRIVFRQSGRMDGEDGAWLPRPLSARYKYWDWSAAIPQTFRLLLCLPPTASRLFLRSLFRASLSHYTFRPFQRPFHVFFLLSPRDFTMSSAIPHVIAYLTRPLAAVASPAAVKSAQLILNASLRAASATFTLTSIALPTAIRAAAVGSAIPWATWFNALAGGRAGTILLFYGPGYLKVRVGEEPVTDLWSEETQGSVVPISKAKTVSLPLLQQSTGARLRAALLSARVRSMRRTQLEEEEEEIVKTSVVQPKPIRVPTLFIDVSDDDSSDDESDCSSSSSFASDSTESLTSAGSSPPASPASKLATLALPCAPPLLYRAPRPKVTTATRSPVATIDRANKQLTSYLYQGGVTRVMTGGVMLGGARQAVVASKRA
ncbi:hypothetical protein FB45DRAFT_998851, partial [Roridomyces roridus]